ncbi:unnamed protein product [marine sediment metagenome]|uniref:Uncharacterized protein n=1 Tax=marine sediment metagenome TaxID=412755 RepID=X0SWQ3_9ZZZZ
MNGLPKCCQNCSNRPFEGELKACGCILPTLELTNGHTTRHIPTTYPSGTINETGLLNNEYVVLGESELMTPKQILEKLLNITTKEEIIKELRRLCPEATEGE